VIGIVLIAHSKIASEIKAGAAYILQTQPCFEALDVISSDTVEAQSQQLKSLVEDMSATCDGILVMVDIFGATPCNMAMKVLANHELGIQYELVAGFNLPSVLKALMERKHTSLAELATLSLDAGREYMRLGSQKRIVEQALANQKNNYNTSKRHAKA